MDRNTKTAPGKASESPTAKLRDPGSRNRHRGLLVSLGIHAGLLVMIGQSATLPAVERRVSILTCVLGGLTRGDAGRRCGGSGPGHARGGAGLGAPGAREKAVRPGPSPEPRPFVKVASSRPFAASPPPASVAPRIPTPASRPAPSPVASRPVTRRRLAREARRRKRPPISRSVDSPTPSAAGRVATARPEPAPQPAQRTFQGTRAISSTAAAGLLAGSAASRSAGHGSGLPGAGCSRGRGTGASGGGGLGGPDGRSSGSGGGGNALPGYLQRIRGELERAKRYPEEARTRSVTGKVRLSFRISEEGRVEDATADGDAGPELTTAALALLSGRRLPDPPPGWDPATRIRISLDYRLE